MSTLGSLDSVANLAFGSRRVQKWSYFGRRLAGKALRSASSGSSNALRAASKLFEATKALRVPRGISLEEPRSGSKSFEAGCRAFEDLLDSHNGSISVPSGTQNQGFRKEGASLRLKWTFSRPGASEKAFRLQQAAHLERHAGSSLAENANIRRKGELPAWLGLVLRAAVSRDTFSSPCVSRGTIDLHVFG